MKTYILNSTAEAAVTGGDWLIQGAATGVIPAVGATAATGIAETSAVAGEKVGCVKQALIKVTAAAATYAFGDALELDATGQVAVPES